MSDHYHYDYAETRHDHRGEYADDRHDHYDYAQKYHGHADLESLVGGLREDLNRAYEDIGELRYELNAAMNRIESLEDSAGEP
jgi:hypothetical protein